MKYFFLMKAVALNIFLLYTFNSFAQTAEIDSINYAKGISNAVVLYKESVYPPTGLYNGRLYADYAYTIKEGNPFFLSPGFNAGSIVCDGLLYENIPMMYDEINEEIVIKDPYGIYKFYLVNERVSGFEVLGHKFIRMVENDSNRSVISTGFYDVLYEGNVGLYKKEKKTIQEDITFSEGLKRYIVQTDFYYIKKANLFYPVNNKGSLLSILQNKRKEVQQFMRKNKLNLRKDKEHSFTQVAAYYDSINR